MGGAVISFKFEDRTDAGRQLADRFAHAPPAAGSVVLALPRGGIPVAAEIAARFGLPLEPLAVRKLGVPHFPEFAMGALATGDQCVVDRELVRRLHLSDEQIDEVIRREREQLQSSERKYRISVPLAALKERPVMLVDDGMATGSTMQVAIAALRAAQVGAITVAVPVMAREAAERVARVAQQVVAVCRPEPFESVGQWYRDFRQIGDDEVIALLSRAQRLPAGGMSSEPGSSH